MSTLRPIASSWLSARRAADGRAREAGMSLVHRLVDRIGPTSQLTLVDLGAGTGANPAWLAPRIHQVFLDRHGAAPEQHWLLLDHDPDLLAARDTGRIVGVATCRPVTADVAGLAAVVSAQSRPVVVTCSALLDLLTGDQLGWLAEGVVQHADAALLALTVTGRVRLSPGHRDDPLVLAAFNAHQQRSLEPVDPASALAGPRGWELTAAAFGRSGWLVQEHPTPWLLGAAHTALLHRWLGERVEAALEQMGVDADPHSATVRAWWALRREEIEDGRLEVQVSHVDGLALPGAAQPSRPA